jgi:hypothetical protein
MGRKSKMTIRKEIKKDLYDQLERNGTFGRFFEDLIEDYMRLWDTKNALLEDIEARGVSVIYDNGGGQRGVKKNDSVDQVIRVNAQMLKILDNLEIKPAAGEMSDDDEL